MAGFPQIFRRASTDLINFNWQDFINDMGYLVLYGTTSDLTAGTSYFLTPQVIDGNPIYSIGAADTSDEYNFDITFQKPANVAAGDAYITFTDYASANTSIEWTIKLYHVSVAAVETAIGTATTASYGTGGVEDWYRRTVKMALSKKHFGIGEKLRLEMISSYTNLKTTRLYHDPASNVTVSATDPVGVTFTTGTDLILNIPFKL